MDTSFRLAIAGLLILSTVIVFLALNKRPTELLILIQAVAVIILAAYAIDDRSHRYISLVFVLVGARNLGRRLQAKHRA